MEKTPVDFNRLIQILNGQVTHPEFKEEPNVKDFLDCVNNTSSSSCCAEKAKELRKECMGLFTILKEMSSFAGEIRGPLQEIIGGDFEIVDDIPLDTIKNFLHLCGTIALHQIELTDVEKTWIDVMLKHEEAHNAACCQTRKEIFQGGQAVYLDLVKHIDSQWSLIEKLKEGLKIKEIKFYDNSPGLLIKSL